MLNDWKEIREDVWKNKKAKMYVYITWFGKQGDVRYEIFHTRNMYFAGKRISVRNFKLKTEARNLARQYMRSH
jgi:hypothetical protein